MEHFLEEVKNKKNDFIKYLILFLLINYKLTKMYAQGKTSKIGINGIIGGPNGEKNNGTLVSTTQVCNELGINQHSKQWQFIVSNIEISSSGKSLICLPKAIEGLKFVEYYDRFCKSNVTLLIPRSFMESYCNKDINYMIKEIYFRFQMFNTPETPEKGLFQLFFALLHTACRILGKITDLEDHEQFFLRFMNNKVLSHRPFLDFILKKVCILSPENDMWYLSLVVAIINMRFSNENKINDFIFERLGFFSSKDEGELNRIINKYFEELNKFFTNESIESTIVRFDILKGELENKVLHANLNPLVSSIPHIIYDKLLEFKKYDVISLKIMHNPANKIITAPEGTAIQIMVVYEEGNSKGVGYCISTAVDNNPVFKIPLLKKDEKYLPDYSCKIEKLTYSEGKKQKQYVKGGEFRVEFLGNKCTIVRGLNKSLNIEKNSEESFFVIILNGSNGGYPTMISNPNALIRLVSEESEIVSSSVSTEKTLEQLLQEQKLIEDQIKIKLAEEAQKAREAEERKIALQKAYEDAERAKIEARRAAHKLKEMKREK